MVIDFDRVSFFKLHFLAQYIPLKQGSVLVCFTLKWLYTDGVQIVLMVILQLSF